MDMFAPWESKLILSQKFKDYNIIKHVNEKNPISFILIHQNIQ